MSDRATDFAIWRSGVSEDVYNQVAGLSVTIEDVSENATIDIRLSSKPAIASAETAIGFALPIDPRTSNQHKGLTCLWFSIDQWLLRVPRQQKDQVVEALNKQLGTDHAAITDVSDMRSVLRVKGPGINSLLMKSTSLDIFAADFVPGTVRRVSFGEIAAAVHLIDEETFDLYVFSSYTQYALDWITEAAGQSSRIDLFETQGAPIL